ncbi:MAG: SIMPL domain-containing protein [Pleurocapsa sp. SU_196_0]|nr:SIMPL domain-containing protein [Pleurocapsa sp. SU_196_0]
MQNSSGFNFLGMLALAIAIVLTGWLASSAIRETRNDQDITVTGSAKKTITSDLVQWKGNLTAEGTNLAQVTEQLRNGVTRFRNYVTQNGKVSVKFAPLSSEPQSFEETSDNGVRRSIAGFRVRQAFEVETTDVTETATLAGKTAEAMLGAGVPYDANLSYLYTKIAELRLEMLEAATADAKKRAETIAKGASVNIGAARNARVGVFQITAKNSPEVDDYGAFDTSSIEKDITAVVSVTFAVK